MNGLSLEEFLPMPPWEGPPLPRFLRIFWPWSESESASQDLGEVLYQNSEELEIVRGANGLIEKVIRHIRVTKNA